MTSGNDLTPAQSHSRSSDTEWKLQLILACGALFAGLSHIIPVPFLDDYLVRQSNRHLLGSIMAHHHIRGRPTDYAPVYAGTLGCIMAALWFLITLPVMLVIKILKKFFITIFFFLAIRSAAIQIVRTLLLGRAIDRCFCDQRLPREATANNKLIRSRRFYTAFDKAFQGADVRILRQVVVSILKRFRAVANLGLSIARLFRKTARDHETIQEDTENLNQKQQSYFNRIADMIADTLGREDVQEFLTKFDGNFDQEWKNLGHS